MAIDPYLTKIEVVPVPYEEVPEVENNRAKELGKKYDSSLFTFVKLEKKDFLVTPSQCKTHNLIFMKHKLYSDNRSLVPLIFPNCLICTVDRPFDLLEPLVVKKLNVLFQDNFLILPLSVNKNYTQLMVRGANVSSRRTEGQCITTDSFEVIDLVVAGCFRTVRTTYIKDAVISLKTKRSYLLENYLCDLKEFEACRQVALVNNNKQK